MFFTTTIVIFATRKNLSKTSDMYTLTIETQEGFVPDLPSFTFSHTLQGRIVKTVWLTGEKVTEELQLRGLKISKQTLFNLEAKNQLETKRLSSRKVLFNLNEVLSHFSLPL